MELGLGTVQFGLDYGVSNKGGKVSPETVKTLLDLAYGNGIRVLDTAAAYGDSEQILGDTVTADKFFRIITKLPGIHKETVTQAEITCLDNIFHQSLQRLKTDHIEGLLLHRPGDVFLPGGENIYSLLCSLKEQKYVNKIGISVYTVDELNRLFSRFDFDLVQLPLNVLDQRFVTSGCLSELKAKGVEIHVRSAFLQGLLLIPPEEINEFFAPIKPTLVRYRSYLEENGLTAVEGALAFLRLQKNIDVVLAGVTNETELRININAFSKKNPPHLDFSSFTATKENMINPQFWQLK
ncbi:MAG: aldo/keto reductase [Candidatus Latescibacteria bacterium]|nr:aldo/keto reductase [Candidatus Latescibacterota bacterium]